MSYDYLLKDASIIDEEGNISNHQNIYIQDSIIRKVTHEEELYFAKQQIDCSELYVTPGLVNLHTHSPMNIFKGMAEDVHIDDWFNKVIWPFESKMTGDDVYCGALGAIEEMIDNGVTAFADHYMYADRICDAVIKTGIKGDIAPAIFGVAKDFNDTLENCSELISKINGAHTRLHVRIGPHSPYTCPEDTLKTIIDRAKALGVGIHIHVSETHEQVEQSIEKYSKTPFEILKEAGGFDIPSIIAHGLWISDEDRKYLNDKTVLAVSPKTYMKLSMGTGHLWDRSWELPLCTGTDGAASSNTLNPLEQAKMFALIGKLIKTSTEYDLRFMWKMLMRGHEALPFNSGKVKEGYAADLVVWDLRTCNTAPVYNPLASLLYSADSRNVLYTFIDGRPLKKNGQVQIEQNSSALFSLSRDIMNRGQGVTNLSF